MKSVKFKYQFDKTININKRQFVKYYEHVT